MSHLVMLPPNHTTRSDEVLGHLTDTSMCSAWVYSRHALLAKQVRHALSYLIKPSHPGNKCSEQVTSSVYLRLPHVQTKTWSSCPGSRLDKQNMHDQVGKLDSNRQSSHGEQAKTVRIWTGRYPWIPDHRVSSHYFNSYPDLHSIDLWSTRLSSSFPFRP